MDNKQRQIKLSVNQRLTAMSIYSYAIDQSSYQIQQMRRFGCNWRFRGMVITLVQAIKCRRRCLKLFCQANRGFCI